MSAALPLPLQQALRTVMPPQAIEQYIHQLERELARMRTLYSETRAEEVSLLRLPFKIEVESRPAVTHLAPEDCREAEYAEMTIDDDLVRQSADTILDRHMQEWEELALDLQRMRQEDA